MIRITAEVLVVDSKVGLPRLTLICLLFHQSPQSSRVLVVSIYCADRRRRYENVNPTKPTGSNLSPNPLGPDRDVAEAQPGDLFHTHTILIGFFIDDIWHNFHRCRCGTIQITGVDDR